MTPLARRPPDEAAPAFVPSAPFPFMVLVRVPLSSAIPIFALGVEKGRATLEHEVVTGAEAVNQVVAGNIVRVLVAGRYGAYQVVHCRRRVEPRTAIYSTWLAFAEGEHEHAFLRDHPQLGFDAIEQQIAMALLHSERRLSDDLSSGLFDLGRLHEGARNGRAHEYLALAERVRALRLDQQTSHHLRQARLDLRDGWVLAAEP